MKILVFSDSHGKVNRMRVMRKKKIRISSFISVIMSPIAPMLFPIFAW